MKLSKTFAALSLVILIAFSASAQTTDKKRVRQGVRSGVLIRTEMS